MKVKNVDMVAFLNSLNELTAKKLPVKLYFAIKLNADEFFQKVVPTYNKLEEEARSDREKLSELLSIENELTIQTVSRDLLEKVDESTGKHYLPGEVKKSLGFILASIALWFTGYNAITTAFSKYATIEWGMTLGKASMCLTLGMGVAIVSYIPIGELASRIGRKRTIILGVLLLTVCFAAGYILSYAPNGYSPLLLLVFAFIGVAWAAINVNSLPMVVEMCKDSDIGKYTGYYYTCSMAALIVTPILSGILLQYVGYWTLFPYGAFFVFLSFITMLQVKHGDNKPSVPKSKLEMFDVDD